MQTFAPLGYDLVLEVSSRRRAATARPASVPSGRPQFWIGAGQPIVGRVHFAFMAKDRAAVDAFHEAALEAGGKDNGAPGLRPHYHANYYGAFVLDPDGHNIEAVCRLPA